MEIVFAVPHCNARKASEASSGIQNAVEIAKKAMGRGKVAWHPGFITFDVVDAFNRRATAQSNAKALRALMACLVRIDLDYLQRYPTVTLYQSGVYYKRTVVWDSTPALYVRGYGDCKSLAATRAAELILHGFACRPVFRFAARCRHQMQIGECPTCKIKDSDMTMFHILVMYADGTPEDPSKVLGMPYRREITG